MGEHCLKCWNRLYQSDLTEKQMILSKDLDTCELCGKIRHIVIGYKKGYVLKLFIRFMLRR